MKNRILSVRLSEDERNDQRGDEPAVPDIILIRNQYPDAAALHRVLDYVCRSGMIGGYALHTDSAHCHLHLVVNSVPLKTAKSTSADSMIFSRSAIFCKNAFRVRTCTFTSLSLPPMLTASDAPTMTNCCGSIKTAKEL